MRAPDFWVGERGTLLKATAGAVGEAIRVRRGRPFEGTILVPGDKSISHRAVLFGSLSAGETVIDNFLPGADCQSSIACCRALGVEIQAMPPAAGVGPGGGAAPGGSAAPGWRVTVRGEGLAGLLEPADVLDAGNSGTTMRLMLGILAGLPFFTTITGDSSLRSRPMGRVVEPLRQMGASIWGRQGGRLAPLAIQGGPLRPMSHELPVASAQVKSAILLAGLSAGGRTEVTEPHPSRDHSERMLRYFGAPVEAAPGWAAITGPARLTGRPVTVPGDISSAAFFLVAAAIVPGSRVTLPNVGVNPTRTGILEVLQAMGAPIHLLNEREEAGEPVADIVVESGALRGVEVGGAMIPRLIDEVPILAVAAACAEGVTEIRDAQELKVKESDRLAAVARELSRLGADVEALPDGLRIRGGRPLRGAPCQSYGDHRMAMAMAVAGLAADGETTIDDAACVAVSFPGFASHVAHFLP